jgi:eukaryotic-like serine/threonine-protein kinase
MGSGDTPRGQQDRDTLVTEDADSRHTTLQVGEPTGVKVALTTVSGADRYERREILGEGGMGAVWLAEDRQIGRRVAVKVVHSDLVHQGEAVTRFLREARVQGQLEHPAVVPVYDVGTDADGAAFFTMKRVRGVTLAQVIEGRSGNQPEMLERFGLRRLLTDFAQVCLAVDFAHGHGVLHRDLKPENIMFGDYGEVYVLDWGVAKILAEPGERVSPSQGIDVGDLEARATGASLLGTPAFMAPEQLLDEPAGSLPGADVYSLGCILFEVLTGLPANDGQNVRDVLAASLRGVESTPSTRAPHEQVAPELEAICVKATARLPEQRYRTARALHDVVERYLDGRRNEELRCDLARDHALTAAEAVARIQSGADASVGDRRRAMQEIGRSLALDPSNDQAVDAMVQLLAQPPRDLPDEVRRELVRSDENQWRWTGKVAGIAYLSLAAYLPLMLWSGVRSVTPLILYYGLALASAAAAFSVAFTKRPQAWMVLSAAIFSTLCQASTAAFFGPLVLTPALVATNTSGYAILLRGWQRWFVVAFACTVIYGLVMLDLLDVTTPRYIFGDEGMTIRPGAIGLRLAPSMVFLGIAALATILTATLSVSRIRDSLADAERKLHLYAWQIRQLVPSVLTHTSDPRNKPSS